ncbi:hypothetical protein BD410DRAFT_509057 [Rickenella mellea]|uniref:Transmembrane protein n=1 Tax=Rickenella mellea TaxID=50990 RepID=A0A4Y7PSM7_9AGAM|nr:hypothetical protein BD410DRAFT_509057 [Rickenella mellea]
MLPAILLMKIGFMSIVGFMLSELTSPNPSFLQAWSLPERIGGFLPQGLISSSPSVVWAVQLTDLFSVLTLSPVAYFTSQPPLVRLPVLNLDTPSGTCEWSTDPVTFSWFRLSVNKTRISESRWIRHSECTLSSGAPRPLIPHSLVYATAKAVFPACLTDAAVDLSSPATRSTDQRTPPRSTDTSLVGCPLPPLTTPTTCPSEDSPHPIHGTSIVFSSGSLIVADGFTSSTTPPAPSKQDRRQVTSSPSSPNILINPLFYVAAACPVHAQYTLPLLDILALPTLTEVKDVSRGTASSSQVLSDMSDVSIVNSWSLSSLTSRRLLERLMAKVLCTTAEWAVAIFWLAVIFSMVLALLFAVMFVLGSQAIFASLRRADLDSSPQENTFIYAVQITCSMSSFAVISAAVTPAFIPTCDVDFPEDVASSLVLTRVTRKRELVQLWLSRTLPKQVPGYHRFIITELVLTDEICERFGQLLQSLIDCGIINESPMVLDEPSFDSLSPPSPVQDLPPATPPPSTPPRQTRRPRVRQMSLSLSPCVVSRSMPSPDPFTIPVHDNLDPLDTPLEGEIHFPDDLDGSFGLDDWEGSVSLFTPELGATPNPLVSEEEHQDSPLPPAATLTDPFSSANSADEDSYGQDEVEQSSQLDSSSGTLSFSLVEDDDQEDAVDDSADTSDQSIVESTNFREYFDYCGVEFEYIDVYRPVQINDEGDTVPRRSTVVVLQAEDILVSRTDWSDQLVDVPGLRVILAFPASFKATTRHLNVSMMILSCEASFSRLDPASLDLNMVSGAATHVSYWKRDVKIDISGDPPEQIPVNYADYDFDDDKERFEVISDEEAPSNCSQSSLALSGRSTGIPWPGSGGLLSGTASPNRLTSWPSPDAGHVRGTPAGLGDVFGELGPVQKTFPAPPAPRLASSLSMESSFAEDGFSESISSCADDVANQREVTPSLTSDSFSERLSVSPDFPNVPMKFEDFGIFEDTSFDDAALFTPSKSHNDSHSNDSEMIRRCFGSRRREMEADDDFAFCSSFGSPRASGVRRRKPLGVHNTE